LHFLANQLYNNSWQTGEGAAFEDFSQLVIVNAKISVLKVVTSTFPLFGLGFIFSRFIFEIILMAIFPDIIFFTNELPIYLFKIALQKKFHFCESR